MRFLLWDRQSHLFPVMSERLLVGAFRFSTYSHRGDKGAALVALAVSCFIHT